MRSFKSYFSFKFELNRPEGQNRGESRKRIGEGATLRAGSSFPDHMSIISDDRVGAAFRVLTASMSSVARQPIGLPETTKRRFKLAATFRS